MEIKFSNYNSDKLHINQIFYQSITWSIERVTYNFIPSSTLCNELYMKLLLLIRIFVNYELIFTCYV
jgi:hypothetical protein